MAQSLYEKLGGQEAVAAVVDIFYDRVLADDSISHFFANTDMEKQRRHQTAFISYALGGAQYTGKSMEKAHEGMNLQPEHFLAVAKHLGDSLVQLHVSPEDIDAVLTRVATLKDSILYK